MNFKKTKWKSLEKGKKRGKSCNYTIVSKNKIIFKKQQKIIVANQFCECSEINNLYAIHCKEHM